MAQDVASQCGRKTGACHGSERHGVILLWSEGAWSDIGRGSVKQTGGVVHTPSELREHFRKIGDAESVVAPEVLSRLPPDRACADYLADPSSDEEIRRVWRKMRESAGGPDEVTINMLRYSGQTLQDRFFDLVRRLWKSPGSWEPSVHEAEVLALFKTGDRAKLDNYRAFVFCQLRREWWQVLFLAVFGITQSQWVLSGAINGVFDLAGPQEMLFFLLVCWSRQRRGCAIQVLWTTCVCLYWTLRKRTPVHLGMQRGEFCRMKGSLHMSSVCSNICTVTSKIVVAIHWAPASLISFKGGCVRDVQTVAWFISCFITLFCAIMSAMLMRWVGAQLPLERGTRARWDLLRQICILEYEKNGRL